MTKCPYVPPHEWNVDFPQLMLRAKSLQYRKHGMGIRDWFLNMFMEHKKNRRVAIGANANLYFEDRITMHYQIQEILRPEKIFEDDAIAEELAVYNALIPDGCNWKDTFMLEYSEVSERVQFLQKLVGVEHMVWVRVGGEKTITAIADEDLERSTEDKTSAVHFLRFELDQHQGQH